MNSETCANTRAARPAWWPALLLAVLLAVALVLTGYAMHGKPLADKTLTTLVMPIGLFWVVLTGRVVQLLCTPRSAGWFSLLLVWILLMSLGTRPLPRLITRGIESSVSAYNPARDEPFDVVVVLGGGTSEGHWRSQASGVGDRLVMAAELYHAGLTKKLITTGETTKGVSDLAPDPSEQTFKIWTRLKVAPADIRQIGGHNTYEEMQNLKRLWPELAGKRVGLLTSALHLPRAVRLAKAQGLEMTPIAADVRTAIDDWGLLNFIPSAGNFCDLGSAQHEIMAWIVSR